MADYYEVLGVDRDVSPEELKKRFRELARKTHPDANPDDPTAEQRFRDVAQAYEVLSDPQKRASYDRGEVPGGDLFSQFGGLDDILQQFFGGGFGGFGGRTNQHRGSDVAVAVQLSLAEAASGVSREVSFKAATGCEPCGGSGAANPSATAQCTQCRGAGMVQVQRSTILGAMMTVAPCSPCSGTGVIISDPCTSCLGAGVIHDEQQLAIEIPAGVDDGTRLRLTGRGAVGERGAPAGDLFVQIQISAHEDFVRNGDNLHYQLNLGVTEATFGTDAVVPLVDGGNTDIDIPAGTQPGTVFRLAKEGMPRLRRRGRGDMLIEAVVTIPTDLDEEQETSLRAYGELRDERPAQKRRKRRFRSG